MICIKKKVKHSFESILKLKAQPVQRFMGYSNMRNKKKVLLERKEVVQSRNITLPLTVPNSSEGSIIKKELPKKSGEKIQMKPPNFFANA